MIFPRFFPIFSFQGALQHPFGYPGCADLVPGRGGLTLRPGYSGGGPSLIYGPEYGKVSVFIATFAKILGNFAVFPFPARYRKLESALRFAGAHCAPLHGRIEMQNVSTQGEFAPVPRAAPRAATCTIVRTVRRSKQRHRPMALPKEPPVYQVVA